MQFISTPLAHWAVARCRPFSDLQGTSMLQQGHRGWGRFHSSKMIMVSQTRQWKKCICIAVLVAASPGKPSMGQLRGPPMDEKAILYVRGSSMGAVDSQRRLPSADLPYYVYMCPASEPSAISPPHYLHLIQPLCLYHYTGPSSIILLPYATSNYVPAAWHG